MNTRSTLLLIPGLMCDAAVWADQRTALAAQADIVIVDHGLRDSIEAMARHAIETAPAGRFAVAGHSMGGRVALEVFRLAPERVAGLALLDTGCAPLAGGEHGEKERAGRLALLAQARAQGMRAMGREWARGMVHPERLGTPLFDAILDMLERSNPAQFEAQITALLGRPDAGPLLPHIQCPTLLLCGREDGWSPPQRHADMQRQIAGSTLEIVEQSGHMSTMEQPAAVSAALARWLAGVRA
jgi:pimeloyl-ACP methyl ester carboxylesterase